MLASPESVIKGLPPGTMIYARVTLNGKDVTAFLIREESSRIARWKRRKAQVQLRAARLSIGDVLPVVFMARLGDEIYETWLNVHQEGGDGFGYLRDLATQDQVHFILYGDGGRREGKVSVLNSIQEFARNTLKELQESPAWSMKDFDAAREHIYKKHPSVADLWKALGEMSGVSDSQQHTPKTRESGLPRLDVVDSAGHPVPQSGITRDLHDVVWTVWNPSHDPLFHASFSRRKAAGVVGIGKNVAVRFLYQRDANPIGALHDIEEADGLDPFLAGALVGAVDGLNHKAPARFLSFGVHLLASICDRTSEDMAYSRMRSGEVSALASKFLDAIIAGEPYIDVPAGAVDRARFWLAVGRLLWKPSTMRRLAASGEALKAMRSSVRVAAQAWFALSGRGHVQVGKARLAVTSVASVLYLWAQTMEWVTRDIPADTLQWLTGGQVNAWAVSLTESTERWTEEKRSLAAAIARSLLSEAEEQAVYVPLGAFLVNLPPGTPLRAWGVEQLRIWAEPSGVWVQAVGKNGRGPSFRWTPHGDLSDFIVAPEVQPAVNATLAALWRDLRVAGEEAFPVHSGPTHGRSTGRTRRPKASRSPRVLPSRGRKAARMSGKRFWASGEERERMHRRAHGVRGHLRKLPTGWHASEEAHETAEAFGVVMPQGYTFVRPHVRGGKTAESIEAETPIVARGLATITSLLGGGE